MELNNRIIKEIRQNINELENLVNRFNDDMDKFVCIASGKSITANECRELLCLRKYYWNDILNQKCEEVIKRNNKLFEKLILKPGKENES